MDYSIALERQPQTAARDTRALPFGQQPTDHMFLAEYRDGAWQAPRIVPFADLQLSPFALCFHYGQTVFEGMKAFRMDDGQVAIFRPDKHYQRFEKSLERMCLPAVPKGLFMEALHRFVALEAGWVPDDPHGALYLRPFVIASEERLGVKVSEECLFLIVGTPSYQYYTKPLRVKVETDFSRAASGGTGYAKCGGNYGGAYYPWVQAKAAGYDQVIWTDSVRHEFIEESGTMNLMFVIDGTLITPPLSDTILDGITRDSLLTLAEGLGIPVEVRPVSYRELQAALESGRPLEAFGAGTAAVVAPIAVIGMEGKDYDCYTGDDAVMYRLRDALNAVRKGAAPDRHRWNYIV